VEVNGKMLKLGIKMLIEDRAKFIGMILGLSFSAFIITQQTAIFAGIMKRTFGFISDTSQAQIWVMDKKVQFIEDIKPLNKTDLFKVKSVEGVQWAVPLFKGLIKARLKSGNFQNCILIGIDENSFIGRPSTMVDGKINKLHEPNSIIVNDVGAEDKLAFSQNKNNKIPLRIGNTLELNDHHSKVVGICKVARTFYSQPVIYTTFNRAINLSPQERKFLSFILVKAKKNVSTKELCNRIMRNTNLAAYTQKEFEKLTMNYYLKNTGIPINFGVAVILGLIIGTAIAGQTFYNFTLDNLRYLGLFKAMGADNKLLFKMTLFQSLWVGFLGWGIGTGSASLFGFLSRNSELSFYLPWELFAFSGISMFIICIFSCFISIKKIIKLETAIVFQN
jgi:putative ABC transport system permease protein